LEPGTTLILGASKKGGDHKRWSGAAKYIKPGVELVDPAVSAVAPELRGDGVPFSATDARKAVESDPYADLFFGDGKTQIVRDILGLDEILEMSSAGGGGLQGHTSNEKDDEDLHEEEREFVNEVIYYLYKQGILK